METTDKQSTEFRAGMRLLAGGVTIVTSKFNGIEAGLTATAVCSLSATPPRLLACVNLYGAAYNAIAQSRLLTVNVLAHDQEELARCFAGQFGESSHDRFAYGSWLRNGEAPPVLRDALVSFECFVSEMLVVQTHAVMLGDVQAVNVGRPASALLYADGDFRHIK
ncbi:MAG: flavin reductase family protein [Hyphomicrobiales bacterium]|nr:flavin reductase family protein [Hyphomicrobiales bacterium]